MLPEYPKFKALDIKDLETLKHALHKGSPDICELSLSNIIIWKDFDHPKATLINGNLCIQVTPPNEPAYFLEPVSHHKLAETVAVCLKDTGKISRASERLISALQQDQYSIKCLRSQFDYVYETKALAELKGRKLDGKRNHLKKFKERFPGYEYIKLPIDCIHIRSYEVYMKTTKIPITYLLTNCLIKNVTIKRF